MTNTETTASPAAIIIKRGNGAALHIARMSGDGERIYGAACAVNVNYNNILRLTVVADVTEPTCKACIRIAAGR